MSVSKLKYYQISTFIITWISYGSLYFLRKPLGIIKSDLVSDLHFSKSQLGWLDTALFLPYASCQVLLGSLGDTFKTRYVISLCLLFSSLSTISFGFWNSFSVLFILLFLNGTAQSQTWAASIKSVVQWYPDHLRNSVVGVFGTCCFAGGICGTALAVHIQHRYGWRSVYLIPSCLISVLSLFSYLLLRSPSDVNILVPNRELKKVASKSDFNEKSYTTLDIIRIPLVIEVSISLLFLKLVRYSFYMWLPMYLETQLLYSKYQAGLLSTLFEIGGVIGTAGIGVFIDRYLGGRAVLGSSISFTLSTISLLIFLSSASLSPLITLSSLLFAGLFNSGPDSILGGSLSAELGEMDGRNAAAFTTAFANGVGACGAALQGPLVGYLYERYGWNLVLYTIVSLSACGCVLSFYSSHRYETMRRRPIILSQQSQHSQQSE